MEEVTLSSCKVLLITGIVNVVKTPNFKALNSEVQVCGMCSNRDMLIICKRMTDEIN